jgi:hypothetical protein
MCVSTGKVGVLHVATSPLAHWDVMPESAAGQDRRKAKQKEKTTPFGIDERKAQEEIQWASLWEAGQQDSSLVRSTNTMLRSAIKITWARYTSC